MADRHRGRRPRRRPRRCTPRPARAGRPSSPSPGWSRRSTARSTPVSTTSRTRTTPSSPGWHRIEYLLWEKGDTAGAAPFADQLDADLADAQDRDRRPRDPARRARRRRGRAHRRGLHRQDHRRGGPLLGHRPVGLRRQRRRLREGHRVAHARPSRKPTPSCSAEIQAGFAEVDAGARRVRGRRRLQAVLRALTDADKTTDEDHPRRPLREPVAGRRAPSGSSSDRPPSRCVAPVAAGRCRRHRRAHRRRPRSPAARRPPTTACSADQTGASAGSRRRRRRAGLAPRSTSPFFGAAPDRASPRLHQASGLMAAFTVTPPTTATELVETFRALTDESERIMTGEPYEEREPELPAALHRPRRQPAAARRPRRSWCRSARRCSTTASASPTAGRPSW